MDEEQVKSLFLTQLILQHGYEKVQSLIKRYPYYDYNKKNLQLTTTITFDTIFVITTGSNLKRKFIDYYTLIPNIIKVQVYQSENYKNNHPSDFEDKIPLKFITVIDYKTHMRKLAVQPYTDLEYEKKWEVDLTKTREEVFEKYDNYNYFDKETVELLFGLTQGI